MKRSISKKETFEDKFARKYWCDNSRLRNLRYEKHANNKKFRKAFDPDKEEYE